jgi:hypothetical protein
MVVAAIALRFVVGLSSGVTLLVLLVGWPLVGTLVTIDDDFAGGWSNPDGKAVPEWKMLWWWADLLLVRGSIVVAAFFVEDVISGDPQFRVLIAAGLMMVVGLPIFLRGMRRETADAV